MYRDVKLRAGRAGSGTDTQVDSSALAMVTGVSVVKTAPAVWLLVKQIAHLSMGNMKCSLRVRNLSFVPVMTALTLKERKRQIRSFKSDQSLYFSVYRESNSLNQY